MEIKESWIKHAKVDTKTYETKYKNSLEDNNNFWREEGKRLDWVKNYTKIKDIKYSKNEVGIKWYYDGSLNVSYNCIDRH
jgi:acetyl-CoA synthetase